MIPARNSEGGSRRSSILKPPKQRQPLQCVVINPSSCSSESSPIVKKVKRRVSFAEKKHVKEFCDSFEQGTVWDNTYEENDSSHQKAIHSGNLDEGSSISKDTNPMLPSSIISLDKENFPLDVQIFKDQSQVNPHSEVALITPFFDDLEPNIQNEVLESSAMDTDLDLPDVLIHTNEMQNFNKRPSEEIPSQEKNSYYSPSFAEENISTKISKSPLQNTIYDNETMAFTKILPSLPQNDKENSYSQPNAEERTERVIHNLSMGFTEAVPHTLYLQAKEREDQDGMDLTLGSENEIQKPTDETQLNDISMEMTTAIPSVRAKISDDDNNDNNDDSEVDNFTRRNLSMEMTSVVPSIPILSQGNLVQIQRDERTRLFRNSMELTAAVPSCYAQDALQSVELNTTGVLSRQRSMEFTSVVPSILRSANQANFQKRTTETDRDKSMEFTTLIPSNLPERTETLRGKSMEFTSVVPSILSANEGNFQKRTTETERDKSMEFTTLVPSNLPERTETLQGKSMEFTSVVPSILRSANQANFQKRTTETDRDKSMEFTTLVPSNLPERTETLRGKSMKFTSVVPSILSANEGNFQKRTTETDRNKSMEFTTLVPSNLPEQTEILRGKSMEFTSVVPSILRSANEANLQKGTTETDRDKSMEFTTLVPSSLPERTETLQGKSMEFTSVVPSILRSANQANFQKRTTETDRDKSMEFTTLISSNLPERTETLRGKSMEFTSVVPSILSANEGNFQKRTTETDRNKSMEFTTLVPSNLPERTEILRIKSMEFNAVVPSCFPEKNIQSRDLEDKSVRLFPYKSMEFKTIPSSLPAESSLNSPDLSIAEKKIRLSIPGDSTETRSLTLENQSNFENCSHVGVEQRLRRSDGIGLLNMELTEPILRTYEVETLGESIFRPSSSGQNLMSDFQEKSLTADVSLSQICMPPLSPNLSLEKSVNFEEAGHSRSKSFELNSAVDISKEVFYLSEGVHIAEESEDEAKEVEQGNEDVGSGNSLLSTKSLVDLNKSEEKLKNFCLSLNSKTIENEEPPSFLNLNTSDENSLEEFDTKDQETLENKNEDLAETLKIGSKRSFEASGICETENQVETSIKRRSIENTELPQQVTEMRSRRTFVVSQGKTTQLNNSVEITESSKTLFKGEKLKERELRIFEIEKGVESQDLGDEIKKRGKKRNSNGKSINVSENSIVSNENSKKGQDRRYTFVINKEMNLNSQDEIQIEEAVLEKNSNEKNNLSFGETVTIRENSSTIFCKREIHTGMEIQNCPAEESVKNDVETPILQKQNDSIIIKDPFSTLLDDIRSYAERDDCIWDVRLLNEKILALNFISKSLVVIIELCSQNEASFRDIKDIKIKSLLPDETQHLIRIAHDLIMHKLHPEILLESHKLYEDVLPLLERISKEVKLALDFMFELQRLRDLNLMEIDSKRISFVTHTKRMDIILEITLNIKPFEEINSDDVNVKCLLGSTSINEVKQLIINVKKDHKFLRRFMNDVRDYVELMEESAAAGRKVGS